MNYTLESHPLFPYIAWSLVISFSVFTYMLTMKVKDDLTNMNVGVSRYEVSTDTLHDKTKI